MTSVEDLRDRPLFVGLGDKEIRMIIEVGKEFELPAGKVVVIEGDMGDCLYVILSGEVEVLRKTGEKIGHLEGKLTMLTADEGDFFGEMAILDFQPRVATVRTLVPARFLVLTREALFGIWKENAEARVVLLSNMVRILSRRFRRILEEGSHTV